MPALSEFSGGWVQKPRHLLAPNECIDILNCVPNDRGALTTRLGQTLVATLPQLDVHSLYVTYLPGPGPLLYAGASGSLYRNLTNVLLTGLNGTLLSFASMRGLNENTNYTFFASSTPQDALRVKDDGGRLFGVMTWGLRSPQIPVTTAGGSGPSDLNGTYYWKQVFIRKPRILGTQGRWIAGAAVPQAVPLTLSTAVNGEGYVVQGLQPYGEVVFHLTTAASAAGTWTYSYWDGVSWVNFLPDEVPTYNALGYSRLAFSFPVTNWAPNPVYYTIRALVATAPVTAAVTDRVYMYDPAVAARSNPSPSMVAGALITNTVVLVGVADPTVAGPQFDPQISHVEIYRSRGDDPAIASGLGLDGIQYFFEGDVPAGAPTFASHSADATLIDPLEVDNDRPLAFQAIAFFQNRLWGLIENRLYYSKSSQPDSFPASNFVEFTTLGDPGRFLAQYDGNLYVWTGAQVLIVVGSDETSYDTRPLQCPTGLGAQNSVARGEKGVYFLGDDGNLWRLQGATVALNLVQAAHYPLFHTTVAHGIYPLNQASRGSCVGAWFNNRYYFSYPQTSQDVLAVVPTGTLFIDEVSDAWYRDSRGFRALFYDKEGNFLYGSDTQGHIVLLDQGLTDLGAPIPYVIQTRDDDEGTLDSGKELVALSVDAVTDGTPMTVETVPDWGSAPLVTLGALAPLVRALTPLTDGEVRHPRAQAFGYRLTGTGPMTLFQVIRHVLVLPPVRRADVFLPMDFGWTGKKIGLSYVSDCELLSPGTITTSFYADGGLVYTVTQTALGRQRSARIRLPEAYVGRLLEIRRSSTAPYLLWGSALTWVPFGASARQEYRSPQQAYGGSEL